MLSILSGGHPVGATSSCLRPLFIPPFLFPSPAMYSAHGNPNYSDNFLFDLDEQSKKFTIFDTTIFDSNIFSDWIMDGPDTTSPTSHPHITPPGPSFASSSSSFGFPQSTSLSTSQPRRSQPIPSQIPILLGLKVSVSRCFTSDIVTDLTSHRPSRGPARSRMSPAETPLWSWIWRKCSRYNRSSLAHAFR